MHVKIQNQLRTSTSCRVCLVEIQSYSPVPLHVFIEWIMLLRNHIFLFFSIEICLPVVYGRDAVRGRVDLSMVVEFLVTSSPIIFTSVCPLKRTSDPMSFANKLLRVIHRIALFIARKLLKFLLPIPFFPNTSIVLAVYVGFTPVNLNPASPPVRLYPRLPASLCEIISKIVGTPHTQVQPDYATENSMDLSEKISTWRQRDLEAARLEAGEIDGSRRHPLAKPQPPKHTRIEQVDFEMPIQGIDKMTEESVQDLEHVFPLEAS